jgi:peptidoglycan/xylan/chitin deacetylase (PgdA/CDA1 family)
MRGPHGWAKDAVYRACRLVSSRPAVPRAILMYHDVGGPAGPGAALFRQQMEDLAARFRVVRLDDLAQAIEAGDPIACVTFDDGYLDATERAVEVLDALRLPATFFIPSGLLGGTLHTSHGTRRLIDDAGVRMLAQGGFGIGGHTMTHPRLTRVPPPAALEEICDDRAALQEIVDGPIDTFAYPKGDLDWHVRAMVDRAGYRYAVTVEERLLQGHLDRLALPRVMVNETMAMSQFRSKLSGGLAVYERFRGRR